LVAPFVCTLSELPIGQSTALRICRTCDLEFFDSRYGDEELSALYQNYRGDEYQEVRRHWEPWYSQGVNDACSTDTDLVNDRRSFMLRILNEAKVKSNLNCAVDFGGDEGQFFPPIPTGRRIVCDVSDRRLPAGIEHISDLSQLGEVKPDLVIVAHVLEHLPDPLAPLRDIRRVISSDGVIYVEVPLDRFRVSSFHTSSRYQQYLRRLVRHRAGLIACDFFSGVSRQFGFSIPTFGVIKQSEHINYFSIGSLKEALKTAGFLVVAQSSDPDLKVGGLRMGCLGVAARVDSGNGSS
jgi:hypothetical protein